MYGQPYGAPGVVQQQTTYGSQPGYPPMYGSQPGGMMFPGQQPYATQPYGPPSYGAPPFATASPYGAPPYGTPPYGAPPGMVQQTTTSAYGAPPPAYNQGPFASPYATATPYGAPPYGAPPGMVQQTVTTGGAPYGGVVQQQTTTSFAPVVSSCFGRPVQLFNHHGKFLCGGTHRPHGHRNPHHGFNQSSYWFIEPHEAYSDKVRLRNTNGKYLCHEGGSSFCSMHSTASYRDVAWHMDMFPGWSGQNVIFRSFGGHYLGCDKHDDGVHCKQHFSGVPHESQRFEIRNC